MTVNKTQEAERFLRFHYLKKNWVTVSPKSDDGVSMNPEVKL